MTDGLAAENARAAAHTAGTAVPRARRVGNRRAVRALHYAMVSPALVLLLAFLVVPSIYVGWLSFHTSTYGQDTRFVGLANYAHLFADRIFWRAFWNTFFVVNGIVYVELLLGLGLAVLLSGPVPA